MVFFSEIKMNNMYGPQKICTARYKNIQCRVHVQQTLEQQNLSVLTKSISVVTKAKK